MAQYSIKMIFAVLDVSLTMGLNIGETDESFLHWSHLMAEIFSHYAKWPSEMVISWNDWNIQPSRVCTTLCYKRLAKGRFPLPKLTARVHGPRTRPVKSGSRNRPLAYAIIENSTPCKYKTVKDIEKPFGIYHYVGESRCCAKIYRNWITHFGWANRGSFSVLLIKFKKKLKQQKSLNHKRWYNLAAHRHNVNVLWSNITYYD